MRKNLILGLVLIIAIANAQNFQSFGMSSFSNDRIGSNAFGQSNSMNQQFSGQSNFNMFPQQQSVIQVSPTLNMVQGNSNSLPSMSQQVSMFSSVVSTANQFTDPIIKLSKITGITYTPTPTTNRLFLRGQSQNQVSNGPQPLQLLVSNDKLQSLINNNKVKDILAIIQTVAASTIKCDTKNAYLNDLLAKIQIGLQVKKFSIDNLRALIQGTQAQFDQLKIDNQNLDQQQKNLKLNDIYAQYDNLLVQLKSAESQYRACNADKQKSDLSNLKNQFSNLDGRLKDLTLSLNANTGSISQTDTDIKNLQNQILRLRQRRRNLINNDTSLKNSIKSTQLAMSQVKDKISILDQKILEIIAKCDELRKAFEGLSQNLNSLKQVVTSTENKFKQLDNKIVSNNNVMDKLSKDAQIYDSKTTDNKNGLTDFSKYVQDMKDVIHYNHFRCNNVLQMAINHKTIDSQATFKFAMMSYSAYLNKAYTIGTGSMSPVQVTPSTTFSKQFVEIYGNGLAKEIQAAAKKIDQPSLILDTDFSCLSTSKNLIIRRGTIKSISNRVIQITADDLTVQRLILGSCSRFDGTGLNVLPKIGSKIALKGAKVNDNILVHSISLL